MGKIFIGLLLFSIFGALGCGKAASMVGTAGANYSQDLQKIADGLSASQKMENGTLSSRTSPTSFTASTPDSDGWFTTSGTIESGSFPYTLISRNRYYDISGNILRDDSTLFTSGALEKIESEETLQNAQMTAQEQFQMTGLLQYGEFLSNPPQSAQSTILHLTGSGQVTYSSGFQFTVSSFGVSMTLGFPGGGELVGATTTVDVDLSWSAENGLYTGTLSARNLGPASPITGDIYRAGVRIGTVIVSSTTNEVTITDTGGRVVRSLDV